VIWAHTFVLQGGISLSDLVRVAKKIVFGNLYIKPAFVFIDGFGHLKLQFEADTSSALAYLYDNLCKQLGISWNYKSPSNSLGKYTSCAMHAAGDRAAYGCGPDGSNSGGFCPQMTLAYSPKFSSQEATEAYLYKVNNYVDYWRSMYPMGVAVGTSKFCIEGGCLGLFLNRMDLYKVFSPELGDEWVEYNGASMAPTYSPAPTWKGGCDDLHNLALDKCIRKGYKSDPSSVGWDAIGQVGQVSIVLVLLIAATLSITIFLARVRENTRKCASTTGAYIDRNKPMGLSKTVTLRDAADGDLISEDSTLEQIHYSDGEEEDEECQVISRQEHVDCEGVPTTELSDPPASH
jgi:hypothetical protein